MSRFTLHEDQARDWIARAVAGETRPFERRKSTDLHLDADYSVETTRADDGNTTNDLVWNAQVAGIIADARPGEPFAPRLAFQFDPGAGSDDYDGYHWMLSVGGTSPGIYAATAFNEIEGLAGADVFEGTAAEMTGAVLALGVLQEAVAMGNAMADELAAYAAG
jgi:hypothetical protein